ncbi:hypothetical protein WJX81_008509 [Elliptochloris bilobata]|uniref:Uncharacterized protein n=1 Tax=Elliptochloris bilobata TaxID=381761 RepID=A0AAW1S218_9CHLO
MVVSGKFDVKVLRADGTPYPEIRAADGQNFVAASPGQVFTVKLTWLEPGVKPASGVLEGSLEVDGMYSGFSYYLDKPVACTWQGWQESEDRVREFKFCAPKEADHEAEGDAEAQQGRLHVMVHRTVKISPWHGEPCGDFAPAATPALPKLRDGKKFFLAPSLCAEAGESKPFTGYWIKDVYEAVGNPLADIVIRYETAGTLLLRKGGGGGGAGGVVIDLTGPPRRPMDPLMQVSCDLTDEAFEPVWKSRKAPPLEVGTP